MSNTFERNVNLRNAVFEGKTNNPAPEMTIVHFQSTAKRVRKAIFEAKANAAAEKEKIVRIYAKALAEEKCATIDAETSAFVGTEIRELRSQLAAMLAQKRARFESEAFTAPTDEQTRLLQALSLRADSLTASEVFAIAERMSDNHQALRTLAALAAKSNISVLVPIQISEVEENFAEVEEYLNACIALIEKPDSGLTYKATEFYTTNTPTGGYFGAVVDAMDNSSFLAVQRPIPTQLDRLKEAERAARENEDFPKAKRIQQFISDNADRLLSADELLDRDINAVIKD